MRHALNFGPLKKAHRRRQIIAGAIALVALAGWRIYSGEPLTLTSIGTILLGAICIGIGRAPWAWMPQVAQDQEWEIEPVRNGLRFHFRGASGTIEGREIRSLKIRRRGGQVKSIHVAYGEQTTLIEHYQDMAKLHAHLLSIIPAGTPIDEC